MSNTEIRNGETFQIPLPGVCATISILIRKTEFKFLSSHKEVSQTIS